MSTGAVYHFPGVEVARPALHLFRGDFRGIVHEPGQNTRFVDARRPQLLRQPVIGADLLRQLVEHGHGDSVRLLNVHAEARHRGPYRRIGPSLELFQDCMQRGSTRCLAVAVRPAQNSFSESSRIVTGPSFESSTAMRAWKTPVSTRTPSARRARTNSS